MNSLSDNYYMDRFGLLRASMHNQPQPGMGPTGSVSSSSSVPFNLVRYSELMNSQTERLINDERHRLLNQSLSQSGYKPSAQPIDSPVLNVNIYGTNGNNSLINSNNNNINERLIENNSNEPIIIPNHSIKQDFSGKQHMSSGSIMSGTPRDVISSLPNFSRKQNVGNISAVKPLNLSSNCEQPMNSSSEQIYLWRPQSDDRKDHNNYGNGAQLDMQSMDTMSSYNRRNSGLLVEDSVQTKGFRGNSFENSDQFSESHRISDKVMERNERNEKNDRNDRNSSKSLCLSERHSSEGLHSRILDNNSLENNKSVGSSVVVSDLPLNLNHCSRTEFMTNISSEPKSKSEKTFCEKSEQKVISKLDLKEIKLKQKRVNKLNVENGFNCLSSDEESNQSDSDDSEDNGFKYNIILRKRMPLELDTSEDKIQFLEIFKLTTHKRKSQLEYNKYVKRRKLLTPEEEESSEELSPESDSLFPIESSIDENKENPDLGLTASNISPDWVTSEENKIEVKIHFMSTLGLCPQNSSERKRSVELLWTGVTKERQIRTKRNKCWTRVLNNLSEETLHKWMNGLQSSNGSQFESRLLHTNGFIQNIQQNNSLTHFKPIINFSSNDSSNSSRFQRKVILFNKQSNDSKNSSLSSSMSSTNRSHGLHSKKDFAQEFHESVLLETAKQQQSRHQTTTTTTTSGTQQTSLSRHYADFSSSSGYRWPGIEAVMDAYDRHSYGLHLL